MSKALLILSYFLIVNLDFLAACKFPSKVAEFVWNPAKIDNGGYYLPMSWKTLTSAAAEQLLPGVGGNTPNGCSRFMASSKTVDTLYFNDCDKQQRFQFKCFHIGQKAWMLDCIHDDTGVANSGSSQILLERADNNDVAVGSGDINGTTISNITEHAVTSTTPESVPESTTVQQMQQAEQQKDLSHTVITTLTDHKSYAFLNRCFYKINQYDWIILSTEKELSGETRLNILSHARSLGYDNGTLY